ncbi:MAG: hypothetical protein HN509_05955 [Halobacteriovoraceae bacterium]|jgi:hypothetical protein|nr:hypothetical protein [Halobacteriovoraceae bacterium]MBT5093707.1 hypothetical protein [Halobacteriovoraceae bacterium]
MPLSTIIFQSQSLAILCILYYGVYCRRQQAKHVKLMMSGIVWDLILVLQIELTRGAIKTATKVATNPKILTFHVIIAITSVLLYFVMFYLGRKVLKGDRSFLPIHKKTGILTLTLRTMVFITSFLVVSH